MIKFFRLIIPFVLSCEINAQINEATQILLASEDSSRFGITSKLNKNWSEGGVFFGLEPTQEIKELRTENTKKFDIGNGKRQVIVGGPFHYKDSQENWQDIDLQIKLQSNSVYGFINTENRFESFFSNDLAVGARVKFKKIELDFGINPRIFSNNWQPISKAKTKTSVLNNVLKYNDLYENIDLEYKLSTHQLFHQITFRNSEVFKGLSIENEFLDIEEIIHLPPNCLMTDSFGPLISNRKIHGIINLVVNNDTLFSILPSRIWDSTFQGNIFETYGIENSASSAYLSLNSYIEILSSTSIKLITKIPTKWLFEKSRVFPIKFDPTINIGNSSSFNTGYRYPLNTCRARRISQILFLKNDINAFGKNSLGKITDIEFYQNSNNGLSNSNVTVKMQEVSWSAMTTPTLTSSGWTTCYGPSSRDYRSGGSNTWRNLPLTTQFTFTNTNNLLVEVSFNNCGNSPAYSSGCSCSNTYPGGNWNFLSASYNGHRWAFSNDCNSPPSGTGCGNGVEGNPAYGAFIPATRITITAACINWSVTPSSQSVPASGSSYSAQVGASGIAGNGCSYSLKFNDSWIRFSKFNSNGYFDYIVDQNTTSSSRTGTISINNFTDDINNIVTLTINQSGSSSCSSPSATVNDKSGTGTVSMTCSGTGGSGGSYLYKWYSGTSCSGSVLGTSSTLNVTSSGYYTCKVYISGYESTCYSCDYGYANVSSPCNPPSISAYSNSPVTVGNTLYLYSTFISGATYTWTGPNGYTSTAQNPIRNNTSLLMSGNYCVVASVGTCSSSQSCVSVKINAISPLANFSSNKNNISAGSSINFFDISSNSPTSWTWTFNGGSPSYSSNQHPTGIKYNTPGQYKVSLTVCNTATSNPCNSKTINGYITVSSTATTQAQPNDDYFIRNEHPNATVVDPIQIGTGTYKYNHTDFSIPSIAGQIVFRRSYNSRNYLFDGPIGFGWTHSFNYIITNFDDTLWQVKYPDGHSADFIPFYNGGGSSFALFGGTTDSLYKTSNGFNLLTKEQTLHQFDLNGRLQKSIDPNDNIISLHYSGNLLDSVIAPGGRYLTFTGNNSTGRISSIKLPSGKTCSFRYDGNDNLITSLDANGDSIIYTYDGSHQLISFINGLGDTVLRNVYTNNKVTAQYDAINQLTNISYNTPSFGYVTVQYPDNTKEIFYHNSFCSLTKKTDALNQNSFFNYDANFYLDTIINEKSQKTTKQYDKFGNPLLEILPGRISYANKYNQFQKPTEIINPRGHKISLEYNNRGNLLTLYLPDTSVRKFFRNSNGTINFYIDGLGDTTFYSYNLKGDIVRVKTPLGIRLYTYDIDGKRDSITDERGNLTLIFYDNNGNPIEIKDAYNQSEYYTWDDNNQLIAYKDKRGYSTFWAYNKKGKIVAQKNALNGIDSFYYDSRDRKIKWRDAMGHSTDYKYDSLGRMIEVRNSVSNSKFGYDEIANLTQITDGNSNSLDIRYDQSNFIGSLTDAFDQTDTMSYDAIGNLKRIINYKGYTKSYEYDPLNQLSQVVDFGGEVTNLKKDKNGNIISLRDGNGHTQVFVPGKSSLTSTYKDASQNTYTITYDSTANIKTITKPVGDIANSYDKLHRLIKQSISTGDNYEFGYDANNNLKSAKNNIGTSNFYFDALNRMNRYVDLFGKEVIFGFNPVGSISYIVYPGGDSVTYEYDLANRLWKVIDWDKREFVYSYYPNNQLKGLLYPTGIHCDYVYDKINRLISKVTYLPSDSILYGQWFEYPNDTTMWEFREGSFPSGIASQNLQNKYEPNDAIITDSKKQYIHDANGNRIKEYYKNDTINYSWTADQLMTSFNRNGQITKFKYDALGHRVERTQGSDVTRYVLNLNSPLSFVLQATDANGTVRRNYIWGLGLLEAIESLGNPLFYHFDANHNTIALTGLTDSVEGTFTYLPKGPLFRKSGNQNQPYTFLGEFGVEMETDSCYYVHARYLDASKGRFISKDPLFGDVLDPQTLNRYAYALNNPITKYDPTGLTTEDGDLKNTSLNYFAISTGVFDDLGTSLKKMGLTRIGSNDKFYFETSTGGVFKANQYVTTNSLSSIGTKIAKVSFPLKIGIGVTEIGTGFYEDGGQFGYNTKVATAGVAGSTIGGLAGAEAGFYAGAGVGSFFGPAGTLIGGIVGAVGGGFAGGYFGEKEAKNLVR